MISFREEETPTTRSLKATQRLASTYFGSERIGFFGFFNQP